MSPKGLVGVLKEFRQGWADWLISGEVVHPIIDELGRHASSCASLWQALAGAGRIINDNQKVLCGAGVDTYHSLVERHMGILRSSFEELASSQSA